MSCALVRFAFAETMSAAMPATIGAEKLVPRLGLLMRSVVYPFCAGLVVPRLTVEMIE